MICKFMLSYMLRGYGYMYILINITYILNTLIASQLPWRSLPATVEFRAGNPGADTRCPVHMVPRKAYG